MSKFNHNCKIKIKHIALLNIITSGSDTDVAMLTDLRWTDNTLTKGKMTNNNLQNTTQKTKDRAVRTHKNWG
jgi:hypothetical protein